jgi:hypothetical protein
LVWLDIGIGLRGRIAREDTLARDMNVHVCIADSSTSSAVRQLLASNLKVCVTPWSAEDPARRRLVRDFGSEPRKGELFVDIDVLLLEADDLRRLEEEDPGRIEELQRSAKVLLLLQSDEVPEALELLRRCDGMIVKDMNLARISDIIEFALHGYFVIPRNLIAYFMLVGAPTRASVLERIGADRGWRDRADREFCATKTTMRSAIRNVAKRDRNGAHARPEEATNGGVGDVPVPAPAKGSATRIRRWRKALHDTDGRVTTVEYVLMLASLALWGAIILEAGGAQRTAKEFGLCSKVGASVQCGTLAKAPMAGSPASVGDIAPDPFGSESASKRPIKPAVQPERQRE